MVFSTKLTLQFLQIVAKKIILTNSPDFPILLSKQWQSSQLFQTRKRELSVINSTVGDVTT
jgi:hypothetical protein